MSKSRTLSSMKHTCSGVTLQEFNAKCKNSLRYSKMGVAAWPTTLKRWSSLTVLR